MSNNFAMMRFMVSKEKDTVPKTTKIITSHACNKCKPVFVQYTSNVNLHETCDAEGKNILSNSSIYERLNFVVCKMHRLINKKEDGT